MPRPNANCIFSRDRWSGSLTAPWLMPVNTLGEPRGRLLTMEQRSLSCTRSFMDCMASQQPWSLHDERCVMKIVVLGGSGLIGRKLVTRLHERGHETVAASPASGVNAVTGAGLAEVLVDAEVVVDVTESPSREDAAVVVEVFEKASRNLLAAAGDAGVVHHVALSIVGADRIPDSGYLRAKVAQEKLIQSAGIPYTILRATQFFRVHRSDHRPIPNRRANGSHALCLSPAHPVGRCCGRAG